MRKMLDRVEEALLSKFSNASGKINWKAAGEGTGINRVTIMHWFKIQKGDIDEINLKKIEKSTGYSAIWLRYEFGPKLVKDINQYKAERGTEHAVQDTTRSDYDRVSESQMLFEQWEKLPSAIKKAVWLICKDHLGDIAERRKTDKHVDKERRK